MALVKSEHAYFVFLKVICLLAYSFYPDPAVAKDDARTIERDPSGSVMCNPTRGDSARGEWELRIAAVRREREGTRCTLSQLTCPHADPAVSRRDCCVCVCTGGPDRRSGPTTHASFRRLLSSSRSSSSSSLPRFCLPACRSSPPRREDG